MTAVVQPAEIERSSYAIIEAELRALGLSLPEENREVILRCIHATADFDYAKNIRNSAGAVECGIRALHAGASIVTDTNMAKAGISAAALRKLGGQVLCYMADTDVAAAARAAGTTRAIAAMDLAAGREPRAIRAVGNAPTALLRIAEQIEDGLRPALVIGVPVGFVNVVESKEELARVCELYDVPYLIAAGRKGGSTVAAAICNALLYRAAGLQDPATRG